MPSLKNIQNDIEKKKEEKTEKEKEKNQKKKKEKEKSTEDKNEMTYITINGDYGRVCETDAMSKAEMAKKVKDYLANASDKVQKQAVQTVKKLISMGKSPLWVYVAITHNSIADIEKYGFKSCYSRHTAPYIDNAVELYLMDLCVREPWGYLETALGAGERL